MNCVGKWIIAGSYDAGKIIDFKKQAEIELPLLDYDEMVKKDRDLRKTLLIKADGTVYLDSKNDSDGIIEGKLQKNTIKFGEEEIPFKQQDDYLVFCIEGGFVFKRIK